MWQASGVLSFCKVYTRRWNKSQLLGQASYLGLMTAEDPSQNAHLHRRLAAAGKAFEDLLSALRRPGSMHTRAFKDLLPALRRPGSMHTRAILHRLYFVPALLYAVPETSGLTDYQLQPLVSAHNAYLRRITGMGRRLDGPLHATAQMCTAAGGP
eukprot:360607-Chlamydomonas_euryale.AAC.2